MAEYLQVVKVSYAPSVPAEIILFKTFFDFSERWSSDQLLQNAYYPGPPREI